MELTPEERAMLAERVGLAQPPTQMQSIAPSPEFAPPAVPEMAAPYDYAPLEPIQSVDPSPVPVDAVAPPADPVMSAPPVDMAPVDDAMQSIDAQPGAAPALVPGAPPQAILEAPERQVSGARRAGGGNPMRGIQARSEADAIEARNQFEEAQVELDAATEAQAQGVVDVADAKAKGLERLAEVRARMAETTREQQQAMVANRAAHEAAMDTAQKEYEDLSREIGSAEVTDRRSKGDRIMHAIALAMASLGDGMAAMGGHNQNSVQQTLSIIDAGIERDLNEQREALNNKKARLAAQNTALGRMRERYGDSVLADKAARDMEMAAYEQQLQSLMNTSLSEQARAEVQSTLGAIQEKRAINQQQIYGEIMQKSQSAADHAALSLYQEQQAKQAATARALASQSPKIADLEEKARNGTITEAEMKMLSSARKDAAEAEIARQKAAGSQGGAESMLPGYEFASEKPPSEGAIAKAQDTYAMAETMRADLRRLAEMRRRNKGGTWNQNDQDEAKAILTSMPARYSNLYGSGAPSDGEFQRFESFLTDPTDYQLRPEFLGGRDPEEGYRRLEKMIIRTRDNTLKGYGFSPKKIDVVE